MKLQEILDFIDWEKERLDRLYGQEKTDKEKVLAICVKLQEEVGEFMSEVLCREGYQRKHKTTDIEKLEGELADVLFVALLAAKRLEIDVEKAIKGKIKAITERIY
jgi:NTP pyrophosphatase (non-canonical NTP hydrolase)